MPELPEIDAYIGALQERAVGATLVGARIQSFSLLRTYDPPISAIDGMALGAIHRMGKRLVFEFGDDLYLVMHLMVAGRLRWLPQGAKIPGKIGLAALDFTTGSLILTEAGTKRRASLHLVRGRDALAALDPGGIEVIGCTRETFASALGRERHTLKRSLTDARLFSGIGGAFADEILHHARLSPLQMSTNLSDEEIDRLHQSAQLVLKDWVAIRKEDVGDGWPEKVTAFHPAMAVHGKYGQECPVCAAPVQRIVYASRETNYCPRCQTGGKILADRSMSRLLKDDWPKTLDELEG